jgi:predicted Zn-dependent protease
MYKTAFCLLAVLIACTATSTPISAQSKPAPVNLDEVIRESLTPDRGQAYLHFAMAKLREKEGDLSAAESEIRMAIALDPKSSMLRSEAAEFLLALQKVPQAIDFSKEAIKLDPNNSDAHFLLASRSSRSPCRMPSMNSGKWCASIPSIRWRSFDWGSFT